MNTESLSKFCAVCKLGSELNALVCEHCGAVFVDLHLDEQTTRNITQKLAGDSKGSGNKLPSPDEGIAFFLFGRTEPFAIRYGDEIYLGRLEQETSALFVDFSMADAFSLGVSRKHAVVRKVGKRYEISDLRSSNGTYLDGKRLVPSTPYELKSGSLIQLGKLKLIAIYS